MCSSKGNVFRRYLTRTACVLRYLVCRCNTERQAQWVRTAVYTYRGSFIFPRAFRKLFKRLLLEIYCEICEWFIGTELQNAALKDHGNWSPHYHTNGLNLLSSLPCELWDLRQWRYVSPVGYCLETSALLMCFISLHLFVYRAHKEATWKAKIQSQYSDSIWRNIWNNETFYIFGKNRGSAVGTAIGSSIDDRKVGVLVPVG